MASANAENRSEDGRGEPAALEGMSQTERAQADRRAARRLLACASAALLAGAAMVAALPQARPALAVAKADGAGKSIPNAGPAVPKADTAADEDTQPPLPPETHESLTPGGLQVVAFLPPMPLTVRDRARLRADIGMDAAVVDTVEPGEALRVVGAVDAPAGQGGPWLQVRYGEGAVGYIPASMAADLGRWRQAQIAERLRRQQEEADAAARASGIEISPGLLPPDLMSGAPIMLPTPSN